MIIDATELRVETPSELSTQSQHYSEYKSYTTLKGLVGIAPKGVFTIISASCIQDQSATVNWSYTAHCWTCSSLCRLVVVSWQIEGLRSRIFLSSLACCWTFLRSKVHKPFCQGQMGSKLRPLQVLGSTWSVQSVESSALFTSSMEIFSSAWLVRSIRFGLSVRCWWTFLAPNIRCKNILLNNLGPLILYFCYRNWPVAIMSFILTSPVCIIYQCLFFRWQLSFLCNSNFSASLCNVTYTKTTHNSSFEDLQKAFTIWNMKNETKKQTLRRINALDRWAAAYQETQLHNQVHT